MYKLFRTPPLRELLLFANRPGPESKRQTHIADFPAIRQFRTAHDDVSMTSPLTYVHTLGFAYTISVYGRHIRAVLFHHEPPHSHDGGPFLLIVPSIIVACRSRVCDAPSHYIPYVRST